MLVYVVSCGWATYSVCGDRVREDLQEDFCADFNTLVDARASFNAEVASLADVYKIERATSGMCWQEKRPYVMLAVYSAGAPYQDEPEYLECDNLVVYSPRE